MLTKIVVASVAILSGLVRAQSVGQASVLNKCDYTVYLANTPSDDHVHQTQSATLAPGQSYTQTYTELANLNGWSIKLAQDPSFPNDATFQYEYTFLNDGTIWFDMSNVNNQLWDLNRDITSSNCTCNSVLRQVAYAAPDDNAAMQTNCTQNSDVTVTICQLPGTGTCDDGSTGSSQAPASVAPTSEAPTSTAAPATTATPTTTQAPTSPLVPVPTQSNTFAPIQKSFFDHEEEYVATNAPNPSSPSTSVATTLSTSMSAVEYFDTDNNIATVWYTDIVTEHVTLTTVPGGAETPHFKRHEHHAHAHH